MRNVRFAVLATVLGLAVLLSGCAGFGRNGSGRKAADSLTVYADSELHDRLQVIAADFSRTTGVAVHIQYGESDQLARQVEGGARADLLILSGEPPMKDLYKQKWIDNYLLFVFEDNAQKIYSAAKPMDSVKYRDAQRLADAVLAQHTEQVTGTNPNL